ncbi:glycosyltransferase family protein [Flavobacterium johnsoniae]|uniref:Uncharacterized protein n=1 Tax=Flavobacterium johnsoniae TaxID=986 RepID=A0A1M5L4C8_FLAJO|nr:hypothetical protein [Flavobacterium johnsoniae]SHG59795.1 hypothetical protein SAMN05444388_103327 [Flavobacterium johnsoniae]
MNILVIAPFPNSTNEKDGFIQRIKKIDNLINENKRVYVQISLKYYIFPKKNKSNVDGTSVWNLNFFTGFFVLLYHVIKSDMIYAHTIYNLMWIIPFFSINKSKIILDVHGAVPEEQEMYGKRFYSKILNFAEKICFNNIDTAVFVTDSMKQHYIKKYHNVNYKSIIYGIWPDNVKENGGINELILKKLREKIGISKNDVVVIYSGGLHIWQNIDLMIKSINDKKNDSNVVYILLVNDIVEMRIRLEKNNINKRIYLDSVHPSELANFYAISHYGFVLREDCVVNRVANPTKLIEYLFYGITPIVKLEEIGDFKKFNYSYMPLKNYQDNILNTFKSQSNEKVVANIFDSYNEEEFKKQIFVN